MGRRGALSLVHELVIDLVMFGLFAAATISYVVAHTNGEMYFSRLFAADVATNAEVVNAGYGDVTLRYDNLKQHSGLSFNLANGRVGVGKGESEIARAYYGIAERYESPASIPGPTFLSLRRIAGTFSVADSELGAATCPAVAHQYALENLTLAIDAMQGTADAFRQSLGKTPVTFAEPADVRIRVVRGPPGEDRVAFAATNGEGASFACQFLKQLAAISGAEFQMAQPASAPRLAIDITISTSSGTALTDEQIGKALAYALAVHYT